MTKPVITTRAGKGSALTWTEGDTNLTNLRDATITVKADTGGTDVVSDLNGTVTLVAGTNVTITGDNTAKTVTINSTASGGASALDDLTDVTLTSPTSNQVLKYNSATSQWVNGTGGIDGVYADTNPSLGGNLTVMGYSIVSSSNGNIAITPNGTGSIVLDGLNWPQADGTADQVLKTNGTGQLSWTTVSGGSSTLDGLSDVTINTPVDVGDAIVWDGSVWLNGNPAFATSATNANYVSVASTDGNTSDTTMYPALFADGTASLQAPHLDTSLSYNASTNALTATTFVGALTGNASTATYASAVTLTADNTTNATNYPLFTNAATGNLSPRTDTGFTYNPSTGTLTATTFTGALSGNASTATTATNATNITQTLNSTTATYYPLLSTSSTTGTRGSVFATDLKFDPGNKQLTVGSSGGSNPGIITIFGNTGSGQINLRADAGGLGNTLTWYFPSTNGSNGQVLTTNGSGSLSWSTVSSSTSVSDLTTLSSGTRYLTMTTATSGSITGVDTMSTSLSWNPTTETLTAQYITGRLKGYGEGPIYDLGTTGGTIAPNVANGNVQKITLNSALTLNAFTSPIAGQSLTLIIYGGTSYTSITSTMKFAGGVKTLTGTAGCIDIVSIYYDGTNYFASLGKGFA